MKVAKWLGERHQWKRPLYTSCFSYISWCPETVLMHTTVSPPKYLNSSAPLTACVAAGKASCNLVWRNCKQELHWKAFKKAVINLSWDCLRKQIPQLFSTETLETHTWGEWELLVHVAVSAPAVRGSACKAGWLWTLQSRDTQDKTGDGCGFWSWCQCISRLLQGKLRHLCHYWGPHGTLMKKYTTFINTAVRHTRVFCECVAAMVQSPTSPTSMAVALGRKQNLAQACWPNSKSYDPRIDHHISGTSDSASQHKCLREQLFWQDRVSECCFEPLPLYSREITHPDHGLLLR